MKKFISLLLVLILVLCAFAGCGNNNPNETHATQDASVSDSGSQDALAESFTGPTVYAIVSNSNPAVGEEIIVDVKLCNAPLFSSIDLKLEFNTDLFEVDSAGNCRIPNIVNDLNFNDGNITYAGFVLTSENVENETIFKLALTPKNGASGLQNFTIDCISFLLALDEQGNSTVDRTEQLKAESFVLNIQ